MGRIKESVLIKGIFPISDVFFHTRVSSWYSRIGQMLSWTPEQVKEWQILKMRQLVSDAYNYSPYYHRLLNSLSLLPEDIRTFDDLKRIPPLTKDIIRNHFDELQLKGKKGLYYRFSTTGGSTGNPTRYIKDNDSWGFDNAFNIWMWKQTGYCYGDNFLALGSSSIFPTTRKSVLHDLYYKIKGKIPFNAMNMSPDVLNQCVKLIQQRKIHYIYGYASSIFLLAKYVEEHHLESTLDIHACFPTSEVLTDVYRSTLERVFQCPVSDMYGAHDGGIVAHNLEGGYKVGYNCIVQTDDMTGPSPAYLTDVTNIAFPFIRYQIGDELELTEGYNSFYNGQVLKRVVGRTSDVIRLENGRVLTGPGFTILFSRVPVLGYRMYKSGKLQITVEVVKDQSFSENDAVMIRETIRKHAGEDCEVIVEYADQLQCRVNGKNLYFLNDKG